MSLLFGRLSELIQDQSARARSWQFVEAATAAAALVACPNGAVSFARRAALDRFLVSIDQFKAFEVHEAVNLFNTYADHIREHPERGRSRALRTVSTVSGNPDTAQLIMEIASTVCQADGGYSLSDVARLSQITQALGLPSSSLGVEDVRVAGGDAARPHVIALGNAKGGTGKSTLAVHLAVALLKFGFKTGAIDLDGGQGTLTRYFENRAATAVDEGRDLPLPRHRRVKDSQANNRSIADAEETARLRDAFAELADCDYVVVDTPGSQSYLARLGQFNADTLITPINDSFLDLDVLAKIDRRRREVLAPSAYCHTVCELRDRMRAERRDDVDWIVLRNRLAHISTRNSRDIAQLLKLLSRRIGFRLGHGLSERIVFRELFDQGLTLLDLAEDGRAPRNNQSHARACREIYDLVRDIGIAPKGEQRLIAAS